VRKQSQVTEEKHVEQLCDEKSEVRKQSKSDAVTTRVRIKNYRNGIHYKQFVCLKVTVNNYNAWQHAVVRLA